MFSLPPLLCPPPYFLLYMRTDRDWCKHRQNMKSFFFFFKYFSCAKKKKTLTVEICTNCGNTTEATTLLTSPLFL